MTTITVWLLIAVGNWDGSNAATTTRVVERFADAKECQRVNQLILETSKHATQPMRCIQATIVVTK